MQCDLSQRCNSSPKNKWQLLPPHLPQEAAQHAVPVSSGMLPSGQLGDGSACRAEVTVCTHKHISKPPTRNLRRRRSGGRPVLGLQRLL
jgi:hypothetical protein